MPARNERRQDAIFSITRRHTDRFMLKSGGKNGTSFLNSRKAKSVLSASYCWKMASKFQEKGGILDFLPRKLFSFPWNLNSFPCNFFFVRWNFYFLGHFFDYKLWFLHKSAQFSSERREPPKKTSRFPAKISRSCEIQKLWESIISDKLFWSYKWRVKLGGKMAKVFLVLKVCASFSFLFPVSIHWTFQANERFWLSHILIHQIRQSANLSIHYTLRFIKYFKLSNKR